MRAFFVLSLVCMVGLSSASVSISNVGTAGAGDSEDNPAEVGETITLRCDFSVSSDDYLSTCQWTHMVDDDYVGSSSGRGSSGGSGSYNGRNSNSNNRNDRGRGRYKRAYDSDSDLSGVEIKCSGNVGDTGCQSGASIDSSYASRLDLSVGTSSCGLSIRDPQPEDNGDWECHVLGQDLSGSQRSLTLYVSEEAEIEITEPDASGGETVEWNMDDENDEIEVTCTAYGGLPTPEFHWYLDNEDNEIRTSDYDYTEREGYDREYGKSTIEHTMTWRPTIEDLCENYELDQRICEDDGDHYDDDDYKTFSFDLICMVEQEGLTDDNSYSRDRMAEVRVEVSSAPSVVASLSGLLLAAIAAKLC